MCNTFTPDKHMNLCRYSLVLELLFRPAFHLFLRLYLT